MLQVDGPRVFELRQYTVHPGQRDVLVDLFDSAFVESQEAVGATVLGQFRDLDRPDRFVWIRGFADMTARRDALTAFYGGPVWAEHRAAANATMVDFDDVLLLRPAAGTRSFEQVPVSRHDTPSASLVVVTVYPMSDPARQAGWFQDEVDPVLTAAGAPSLGLLCTEPSPNTYPALPVRTDEHVLVRFTRFDDAQALELSDVRLREDRDARFVHDELRRRLAAPQRRLRLRPTPRSRLR